MCTKLQLSSTFYYKFFQPTVGIPLLCIMSIQGLEFDPFNNSDNKTNLPLKKTQKQFLRPSRHLFQADSILKYCLLHLYANSRIYIFIAPKKSFRAKLSMFVSIGTRLMNWGWWRTGAVTMVKLPPYPAVLLMVNLSSGIFTMLSKELRIWNYRIWRIYIIEKVR